MNAILANPLAVNIIGGVLTSLILALSGYLAQRWYTQPSRPTLYKRAIRQLELSKEDKIVLREALSKREVVDTIKADVHGPEFEAQKLQSEVMRINSSRNSAAVEQLILQLILKEIALESQKTFYRNSKQFEEKQAYLKRAGKPVSHPVEQSGSQQNTSQQSSSPAVPVLPSTFFTPLEYLQGIAKNCIGREKDLERLESAFDPLHEDQRLLIIEGFGGVGKTTLTAHLAIDVSRRYSILWVNCKGIAVTAEHLLHEMGKIAREHYSYLLLDPIVNDLSLNEEQKGNGLIEFFSYLSKLHSATTREEAALPIALFFDDYYLVEDSALDRLIERVAESQVHVKIILLIRNRLNLSSKLQSRVGTVDMRLEGLSLEDCRAYLKAHESRFPAVTNLNEETIQLIWRRTYQGIPNALEILIAMTRKRSLSGILSQLPNYDPLKDEIRREWFDSLFKELLPEERQVASEVSIFRRPTSREAIINVSRCAAADKIIDALVDRFILIFDDKQYFMHSFWSEYASSLLSDASSKELHMRAAVFYRDSTSIDNYYLEIMSDLESCYHFVKAGEVEEAEDMLTPIAHTLWSWRLLKEFNDNMHEIEQCAGQMHKQLKPKLRLEQGIVLYDEGEMEHAADILNELLKASGIEIEIEIKALEQLALVSSATGKMNEAKSLLSRGIQLAHDQSQEHLEMELLWQLAKIESDYTKMLEYDEQRLKINNQRKDGDATTARAWILHSMGDSYREQGYYDQAMERYQESQDVWNKLSSSPVQVAWLAYDIGQILFEQRKLREAQLQFETALHIFQNEKFIQGIGQTSIELGRIASRLSTDRSSVSQVEEAIDLLRRIKNTIGVAYGLRGLGEVYLNLGEPDQALQYLKQSLDIDEQKLHGKKGIASSLHYIALAYEQQGTQLLAADNTNEAAARLQEAQETIDRAQATFAELHAIANFGGIQDDAKRIEQEIAECKASNNL